MSRGTLDPSASPLDSLTGLSPSMAGLPSTLLLQSVNHVCGPNPAPEGAVWALPRSLAATDGITVVFSSSGYLDVSVHRVSLRTPMDSVHGDTGLPCRVSPFRHPRIKAYVQLPAAFRSLSRLSSAPSARASALRPTMLNLFVSPKPASRPARAVQIWFLHALTGESVRHVLHVL